MTDLVCVSPSPEETRAIAAAVAPSLQPGDVVALSGDLGAGKTCFVQGAAAALGVSGPVGSPSFVLVREYSGRIPVLHADAYRLNTLQELIDLGYEEVFDAGHVLFVEWADAVAPLLPPERLEVDIRLQGDARRISMRAVGGDWRARLGDVRARLGERVAS